MPSPDEGREENSQEQEKQESDLNQERSLNLMADESSSTIYQRKLLSAESIPHRDELVQSSPVTYAVKITAPGDYKRGLLMMEGSNSGELIPATAAGVKSKVCAILADDLKLESGQEAEIAAYFEGRFKASSVILAYESESDNHEDLINAIKFTLESKYRIELI